MSDRDAYRRELAKSEHLASILEDRIPPLLRGRADTYRPTVLIVEDESSIRNAYVRAIRHEADTVDVGTVGEALAFVRAASRLDFAVLDLMLPDGRGDDVARAVREKFPATPLLCISSFLSPALEDELRSLGGEWEFEAKPSEGTITTLKRKSRELQVVDSDTTEVVTFTLGPLAADRLRRRVAEERSAGAGTDGEALMRLVDSATRR